MFHLAAKRILFIILLISAAPFVHAVDSCHIILQGRREAAPEDVLAALIQSAGEAGHKALIDGGKAHVRIGFLQRYQSGFMRSLMKAVRLGLVAEIDSGFVIGPKVLPLLAKLRHLSITSRSPIVHGRLDPADLIAEFEKQKDRVRINGHNNPFDWSPSEVEDFQAAAKELKIFDAYFRYRNRSGQTDWLNFRFRIGNDEVEWNAAGF